MLGLSNKTRGSLKVQSCVEDALRSLSRPVIAIADASRFCYGTASVACAAVGEAREDAGDIVEPAPNTGLVQSHVTALVSGGSISKHGACESCLNEEFRDILGKTSMTDVTALTCFGTIAFECPFFRATNGRKIHQSQPKRGVCSACHTAALKIKSWRKNDMDARVDKILVYGGQHALQHEKIEFRDPAQSPTTKLSECDLHRYEPQFSSASRTIHEYFVKPVAACHCCGNTESKLSYICLNPGSIHLCKTCSSELSSLLANIVKENIAGFESVLNDWLLKRTYISPTRFLVKAREDVMNNNSNGSKFLENFHHGLDCITGPFRVVFMFSRTSTEHGQVALAAHDTADVLRLHEKKYAGTFGVGNVLPGDGTLFVSSTKYSKAGSAWTSLLSSEAAKDRDNGEASHTTHFTFSDLVVDVNNVTSAYPEATVVVFASTIVDFSDSGVHLYNALRTFQAPDRVYIVVLRISKFDYCCGTVSVKELLDAFRKPGALKGSDSASRMLLDSHTRAEEPLRGEGTKRRTGFVMTPHVDALRSLSQPSQESTANLPAGSQNDSQQSTVKEGNHESGTTVIEGVEDCPASVQKKRKAGRIKSPPQPPVLLREVDHASTSRGGESQCFGLVAKRIDPVRENDPLLRWTFELPRQSTRKRTLTRL